MKKYSIIILVILLVVLGGYAAYQLKQIASLKFNINQLEVSAFDMRKQLIQQSQDLQKANSDFSGKEGYIRELEEALKLEINSANMLAYQHSLTILEAIVDQKIDEVNEFTGNEPIGVFIDIGGEKEYNLSAKVSLNDEIMSKIFMWIKQNEVKNPEYKFLTGHGILNQTYGAYHNIVLKLGKGYLWFQFNEKGRLTKISVSENMPNPE